jgi:hypothetical protein
MYLKKKHNASYDRVGKHGFKHCVENITVQEWWFEGIIDQFEQARKNGIDNMEELLSLGVPMPKFGLNDRTQKPHVPLQFVRVFCKNRTDLEKQIENGYAFKLEKAKTNADKKQVIQRCSTAGIIWSRKPSKAARELRARIRELEGSMCIFVNPV